MNRTIVTARVHTRLHNHGKLTWPIAYWESLRFWQSNNGVLGHLLTYVVIAKEYFFSNLLALNLLFRSRSVKVKTFFYWIWTKKFTWKIVSPTYIVMYTEKMSETVFHLVSFWKGKCFQFLQLSFCTALV